jgi:putative flippase GtrA
MPRREEMRVTASATRGRRFSGAMTALAARLPFGLDKVIAPSLLGYAVINSCTFGLDLTILTVLHGIFHWPVAAAITVSYGTASGISYTLNRILNFHSRAPVGRQLPLFVGVIVINYLAWILGVGDGLTTLGINYQLARVLAAVCEAVYMYVAMRWLVFRDARGGSPDTSGNSPDTRRDSSYTHGSSSEGRRSSSDARGEPRGVRAGFSETHVDSGEPRGD